ncbi:hypothetical protein CLOM_g24126, partial [Closterium sp. NIES-68]|jgi:hypothetical protein
MPRAA